MVSRVGYEGADMVLDLPIILQRDDFSCGSVSIEISLRYDGLSPGRWIRRMPSPINGLNVDAMTSAMHAAYTGRILSGVMDTYLLRHLADRSRPVICLITDPGLGGGHWLVSRGVSRGRVYASCPTNGAVSYRIAEFEKRWSLSCPTGKWTLPRFGVCGLPEE